MKIKALKVPFKMRDLMLIFWGLLIGGGVSFTSVRVNNEIILLTLPLIFIFFLLIIFKWPEISFGLFINAGIYKADPRLNFLPDFLDLTIFFGLMTILGITYNLAIKKIKFILPPKGLFIPYIIISLLGTFSLIYTPAPIYGSYKLLKFLTITLLSMLLPFFILTNISSINRFFAVFLFLSVLIILDLISQGINPEEIAFHAALGSNYLAVGRISGVAAIIVLFYFFQNARYKAIKFFYFSLFIVLLAGSLYSGGRGPVIALFTAMFIIFLYELFIVYKGLLILRIKKIHLKLSILMISVILILVAILKNYSSYFETLIYRMEVLMTGKGESFIERMERFRYAWDILISPKGITGLGIGGFSVYYAGFDDERGDYPHNIFLEIGSELGWLGLLTFIFFIYRSFFNSIFILKNFKNLHEKHLAITLFVLLLFMLFNSSISGDINDNRILFTVIGTIYKWKILSKEKSYYDKNLSY